MKRQVQLIAVAVILSGISAAAQKTGEIQTIFKNSNGKQSVTGYGAITNKLTTLRGKFTNISGVYGGVYLNHKFLLGIEVAAVTSNLRVPVEYRVDPDRRLSYEYGQVGLRTEYVINSGRPIHFVATLFGGAGFTVQYERYGNHIGADGLYNNKPDWFVVAEPGVQVEVNLFKWMRFSPGISYRKSFGSDRPGMKDKDISNLSYNATLKFGRF